MKNVQKKKEKVILKYLWSEAGPENYAHHTLQVKEINLRAVKKSSG